MKQLTVLLVLLFAVASVAQTPNSRPQTSVRPPVRVQLNSYLRSAAAYGFSGSVFITKDGKKIVRSGFGWADVGQMRPNDPDTVFDIGSITKLFTTVAIMQLYDSGKIDITDRISKHLPGVPADKAAITIEHLLTHTSGLDHDDFYDEAGPEIREILIDRDQFTKRVLSFPLASEPGAVRRYSNSGFSLLAAIVELITRQSFEDYLRSRVLRPARMSDTGYSSRRWNTSRIAHGYNDGDTDYGAPWDTQWKRPIVPWDLLGNGGLLSTVDDLHRFTEALDHDDILISRKAKNEMFTVRANDVQAYGWVVAKDEAGRRYFTHGGDAVPQGWNAELRWFVDDHVNIIVLANRRIRAGSIRRPVMSALVDILFENKSPVLPSVLETNFSELRKYEGSYKLPSGSIFHLRAVETPIAGEMVPTLVVNGEGQQAIDLLFSGNQLPGLTKLCLEMTEKTAAYIEALRTADIAALKSILPENFNVEETLTRWRHFVEKNGELNDVQLLGSAPLNQRGVQSLVKLKFPSHQAVYKVSWYNYKPMDQPEDRLQLTVTSFLKRSHAQLPLALPFASQGKNEFAGYDLFKGRIVKFRIEPDGRLIFETKEGYVVAIKTTSGAAFRNSGTRPTNTFVHN